MVVEFFDESLTFILADSEFDVWIVGGRSSRYSSHTSLTPDDKVFIFNDEFEIPYHLGFSAFINSYYWWTFNQDGEGGREGGREREREREC